MTLIGQPIITLYKVKKNSVV